MGDALLTVPALRALKTAYPQARLDLLTTQTGQAGLVGLPYIDHLLLFDKYQFDDPRSILSPTRLAGLGRFLIGLWAKKYDVIIIFHHLSLTWGALKFRGLALASGARWRVGLDNGSWQANFLNLPVTDHGFGGQGLTERAYWRQLVETLVGRSLPDYDGRPEIKIEATEWARANRLLSEIQPDNQRIGVIALAAGSGSYALSRRWPAINYARLGRQLAEYYGARIALLGSAAERELNEQIIRLSGLPEAFVNLAGRTGSPGEVVAFLKGCQLFVGNDGGLSNLAGVAGIPSIVVFGPTNHIAWSPFGVEADDNGYKPVEIVRSRLDLACRPCLYRGKTLGSRLGCAARPCLTTISPTQVFETSKRLLLSNLATE